MGHIQHSIAVQFYDAIMLVTLYYSIVCGEGGIWPGVMSTPANVFTPLCLPHKRNIIGDVILVMPSCGVRGGSSNIIG